jgi:Ni/Fe-hydrogenase subunit HybB-like protein
MPIVFLFSAMVSGIAAVLLIYMAACRLRRTPVSQPCLDAIAKYLFYAFIIDFSLEMLDVIHRIYEADESFRSLDFMVHTRLYTSQVIVQIILGAVVPLAMLGATQVLRLTDIARRRVYAVAASLTLIGIFAMRWNVVIGGQLFSKSFLGYTTYKMGFATREGLLPAILLTLLPFFILWCLLKLLPPWHDHEASA